MHEFNQKVIEEFRANGGKVGGTFAGAPMILVTTKGAKSGVERTTPLVHSRDGDNYVIIASYAGAPKHPAWFLNIQAAPEVTVEVGTETFRAKATIPEGAERERLYKAQAALMPNFDAYQQKTSRVIPVVVLSRAD
jgi:deazaflavin-dependent oxidoreductase (nitroreductase family)